MRKVFKLKVKIKYCFRCSNRNFLVRMRSSFNICVLLLVVCFVFDGIKAAPSGNDDEKPVRYDGAQLWRVDLSSTETRQILHDLSNEDGK